MAGMKSTPWKVYVCKPRKGDGQNLSLRAKRRDAEGRKEEQRLSAGSPDEDVARRMALRFEQELNSDRVLRTFLDILEARLRDLESDPAKSPNTLVGFRNALKKLGPVLGKVAVEEMDRATLAISSSFSGGTGSSNQSGS